MFKVNALLLSASAQHKKRKDRHQYPYPLIEIQSFAKHQQGSHQYHHRTGGVNRPHNGYRKILHAEISQYPRRKDNDRLQNNKSVYLPPHHGNKEKSAFQCIGTPCRQHNKRKEYQTGEQRIQREYGNHCIVL